MNNSLTYRTNRRKAPVGTHTSTTLRCAQYDGGEIRCALYDGGEVRCAQYDGGGHGCAWNDGREGYG